MVCGILFSRIVMVWRAPIRKCKEPKNGERGLDQTIDNTRVSIRGGEGGEAANRLFAKDHEQFLHTHPKMSEKNSFGN